VCAVLCWQAAAVWATLASVVRGRVMMLTTPVARESGEVALARLLLCFPAQAGAARGASAAAAPRPPLLVLDTGRYRAARTCSHMDTRHALQHQAWAPRTWQARGEPRL
jgi:hypothetical protein